MPPSIGGCSPGLPSARGRRDPTLPELHRRLPITQTALEFAAARHAGQRREADEAPFILHPLEVAQLLRGRDYPDHVVAAGVLHDLVEDTDVTLEEELERRFGATDAELVNAVSERPGSGAYSERKARWRAAVAEANADAAAIYAADKVAKTRELRLARVRA